MFWCGKWLAQIVKNSKWFYDKKKLAKKSRSSNCISCPLNEFWKAIRQHLKVNFDTYKWFKQYIYFRHPICYSGKEIWEECALMKTPFSYCNFCGIFVLHLCKQTFIIFNINLVYTCNMRHTTSFDECSKLSSLKNKLI